MRKNFKSGWFVPWDHRSFPCGWYLEVNNSFLSTGNILHEFLCIHISEIICISRCTFEGGKALENKLYIPLMLMCVYVCVCLCYLYCSIKQYWYQNKHETRVGIWICCRVLSQGVAWSPFATSNHFKLMTIWEMTIWEMTIRLTTQR